MSGELRKMEIRGRKQNMVASSVKCCLGQSKGNGRALETGGLFTTRRDRRHIPAFLSGEAHYLRLKGATVWGPEGSNPADQSSDAVLLGQTSGPFHGDSVLHLDTTGEESQLSGKGSQGSLPGPRRVSRHSCLVSPRYRRS